MQEISVASGPSVCLVGFANTGSRIVDSASLGTTVVTQAAGEVAAGPGLHFLELQGGQLGRHPCLGSLVAVVCHQAPAGCAPS